jgi:hypothetical protein
MAGGSGNHSSAHRGKQALPNSLGIHRGNRSKWGIPSTPDIHTPIVVSLDIRRLGSRNRCPVGMEV